MAAARSKHDDAALPGCTAASAHSLRSQPVQQLQRLHSGGFHIVLRT